MLEGMQRNRQAVPEALPIQEHWSTVVLPDGFVIEFERDQKITALRLGVPRKGSDVKKGICCVYFVKNNHHFLAMVSEEELNKMEYTNDWNGSRQDTGDAPRQDPPLRDEGSGKEDGVERVPHGAGLLRVLV